jgi:hypothetical protein
MEVTLKPMPAEELDQDGKALEVLGATSRPDTIGVIPAWLTPDR